MPDLNTHFDQFLRERTYLHNISPNTRAWYADVWKVFCRWHRLVPPPTGSDPLITRTVLQEFVVHLRERGVKPVSCNCYMRGIDAFCKWLHQQGLIAEALRVPPQKLEKRLLPIHNSSALRTIISYRPTTFDRWRAHAVACTILDTGCRIEELLTAGGDRLRLR